MKLKAFRTRTALYGAVLACSLGMAPCAFAQDEGLNGEEVGGLHPDYPESFHRLFVPLPIGDGTPPAPRLQADTPTARLINADLAQLYKVDSVDLDVENDASCEVFKGYDVLLYGPDYISFELYAEGYCEGAAEDSDVEIFDQRRRITYHARTGEALDWRNVLPGLGLTTGDDPRHLADRTYSSRNLAQIFHTKIKTDAPEEAAGNCAAAWSTDTLNDSFYALALSAEKNGVRVELQVPSVDNACGLDVTLTTAEMHRYGAPEDMIAAVQAAHAAGDWAPHYPDEDEEEGDSDA